MSVRETEKVKVKFQINFFSLDSCPLASVVLPAAVAAQAEALEISFSTLSE